MPETSSAFAVFLYIRPIYRMTELGLVRGYVCIIGFVLSPLASHGRRMSLDFLLVAGPLVRASSWEPTARHLREAGHRVQVPDVLAYLEAEIKQPEKLTAQVVLKDFVIPNTDLIPEEVRSKVKKWSDYIDYWAVDWDFQNDTFMQGWVAYRTRKERKLPLGSDTHTYEKLGKYRILVKVIDIFGNDTSQAFDVELK